MNFGMIGALGGVGQAFSNQADDLRKEEVAVAEMGRKKDLETWLMQARDEYAIKAENRAEARANTQRTDQVQRVDAASGMIADQVAAGKRGQVNAGIADPTNWTPEQQAAVDQSLAADKQAALNDPMTRVMAAGRTGDLRSDQVATVALAEERGKRDEKKNDQRYEIDQKRLDQQQAFNEKRAEIQDRLAALAESRANRAEGRASTQMEKSELQSTRQALTSVLTDISKEADRIEVLKSNSMDKVQTDLYNKQLETLRKDQKLARGRLNELAGITPDVNVPNERPIPNAAALAALKANPSLRDQFVAKYGEAGLPVSPTKPKIEPPAARDLSPPAPLTAADTAGANVDQARDALKTLQASPRPGLAAGREAIDAYAAKVEALKKYVRDAETVYQNTLPAQGAALYPQRPR